MRWLLQHQYAIHVSTLDMKCYVSNICLMKTADGQNATHLMASFQDSLCKLETESILMKQEIIG